MTDAKLNIPVKTTVREKKKRTFKRVVFLTTALLVLLTFAYLFLFPTVFTVTNSFMSTTEISANYGKIFSGLGAAGDGGRVYIGERVNLQLIPDKVSFSQYSTVLLKSPEYLLKFWNSVFYVLPIVLFQLAVASGASYAFARVETKFRSIVFFAYIILMLMPYQVTLVPNYIVDSALGILNTRWAIVLPGIFSPFSVFILTKYMRRIPSAMVEAAKLDGAGEWQIFTGVYRLLEHGGTAADSAERYGNVSPVRVPVQDQPGRHGGGAGHCGDLYGAAGAAVPVQRGLPDRRDFLFRIGEGIN